MRRGTNESSESQDTAVRRSWGRRLSAALLLVVVLAGAAVVGSAWLWGQDLVEEQRLLPGTTIAAADVSGWTVDEARAHALEVGEAALDRLVTVRADDQEWEVTAAQLSGTSNAEEVVDEAFAATRSASLPDLVRRRWAHDGRVDFDADVVVTVPEEVVAEHVAERAAALDREPVDAVITWAEGVQTGDDEAGRRLDQDAAVAALHGSLEGDATGVDLPVEVLPPAVTDAMVAAVAPEIAEAVDAALDRPVVVAHGDQRWSVSARQLQASPDLAPVVESALAQGAAAPPDATATAVSTSTSGIDPASVPLSVPDEAIDAFVGDLAGQVDIAARNADIDSSNGWVRIIPERAGQALDRDGARDLVAAGLRGEHDLITLPVGAVEPEVTTAAYRRVLLVRQDERKLYLYNGGEIVRSWDVAIGALGHDTPKGRFTVGAKRHLPTWHNPAPNGWGSDMPAVIPPGPGNPLGLRALNWTRGGRDTLIRFHGTANLNSIGQAASKGCVRMRNSDIVELYDLVPSGTAIVSL